MDGTAAPGTATPYSREDHVHPTDTSRAPLASPTFTGTPAAPTATAGTSTTQIATTAFVSTAVVAGGGASPSNANPAMDGTVAPGTSLLFSRGDHVHPSDTSRITEAPNDGQQYGRHSLGWTPIVPAGAIVSDSPPVGAADDALWFESDTGNLYIKYNDGNSSQWVIVSGGGTVNAVTFTPQTLTAPQQKQARSNIGVNDSNVIINGDFRVNQVGYVSAAVLAAGVYGHDQWKAGASGGDYSFTQLKSSTQITIASGKSLIQPIEDVNVVGGSYVLTWTGTAQARAGVNTLTPAGSCAASPLLITGQTAGTARCRSSSTAARSEPFKLEIGTTASPFIMGPYDQELATCMRYYEKSFDAATVPANGLTLGWAGIGAAFATNNVRTQWVPFRKDKRATPSIILYSDNNPPSPTAGQWSYYNGGWFSGTGSNATLTNTNGFEVALTGTATIGSAYLVSGGWVADARL